MKVDLWFAYLALRLQPSMFRPQVTAFKTYYPRTKSPYFLSAV